jgi:hypothetical protein
MQVQASRATARGIGRQSRRNQLKAIIQPGSHPVHRSDKSAGAASYPAQSQTATLFLFFLDFETHK